jgi:nitronate monooxygenase
MPVPAAFAGRTRLPVIAAPMFLVSGPELVLASCRAGIVGTFPALNQRTTEGFADWLEQIEAALAAAPGAAPYGVNLIVHRTNPRVQADLEVCVRYRVPLVITSLGAVREVVDAVHGYGGVVFHDVTNLRHAQKAIEAGVDGLILVSAGAGGHAGTTNPFALVAEIRRHFEGTICLAGCLSSGRDVAAAIAMGADYAYMGTRFIATAEANASAHYKDMIVSSGTGDIFYTPAISGIPANFLMPSLVEAGVDVARLPKDHKVDLGKELDTESKAWKDIWSAGQGVAAIDDTPTVAVLVDRISAEWDQARAALAG